MPPYCSMSVELLLGRRATTPLRNVISLNEPVIVPSMLAPLSPQM